MSHPDELKKIINLGKDPSLYYYDKHLITADIGCVEPIQPQQIFKNIKEFYIGVNQYTLTFTDHPAKDFDRFMTSFKRDKVDQYGISVVHHDGTKKILKKKEYIELMKDFGKMMGFKKLHIIQIHDRL